MLKLNKIKKNVIQIKNNMECVFFFNELLHSGEIVNTLGYINTLNFPIYCSIEKMENKKDKLVRVDSEPGLDYLPFFKIVKKSYVKNMIHLKNEKSIFQKEAKKAIKLLPKVRGNGYSLFQSSLDKNSYEIGCLHIAIDFFFGCTTNDIKSVLVAQNLMK